MTNKTEVEISILGKKVQFDVESRNIHDLKFYRKNPRVLSTLQASGFLNSTVETEEEQKAIFECLQNEQSVKSLLSSIAEHKGISEPIIVQASTSTVLEGNSRLAALRILEERDGTDLYSTVACRAITVNQNQIDSLLSLQHIKGKTEWSAFNKAYVCYHRVKIDQVSEEEYARNTNMTTRKLKVLIEIIDLMISEEALKHQERFSHYEQIVKSRKLLNSMQANAGLKRFLLDKIKNPDDQPLKARDLKEGVPQIAMKPKILKRWMAGRIEYDDAYADSAISQPKQYLTNALRNLKQIERKSIAKLENNDRNVLKMEVKRCMKEISRIRNIVEET